MAGDGKTLMAYTEIAAEPPPWYEQLRIDNENLHMENARLHKENAELRRDNEKLTEIFEFARREFEKKIQKNLLLPQTDSHSAGAEKTHLKGQVSSQFLDKSSDRKIQKPHAD